MAGRTQVVHQDNRIDFRFSGECSRVHYPGEIGRMNAVVDDRPRYAESSSTNLFVQQIRSGLAGKLPNDQLKLGEFLAGKALPKDKFQFAVVFREKGQIAFCTAYVAGENHRPPSQMDSIKPI